MPISDIGFYCSLWLKMFFFLEAKNMLSLELFRVYIQSKICLNIPQQMSLKTSLIPFKKSRFKSTCGQWLWLGQNYSKQNFPIKVYSITLIPKIPKIIKIKNYNFFFLLKRSNCKRKMNCFSMTSTRSIEIFQM